MRGRFKRRFASKLRASADEVFAHATSVEGINEELWPLRLTAPRGVRSIADSSEMFPNGVPVGETLFTSWLMLGPLPLERLKLRLVELDLSRRRFVESSDLFSMRLWQHERMVRPLDSGSEVVDVLTFEPRVRALAPVLRRFVAHLFPRRHAFLRRRFAQA